MSLFTNDKLGFRVLVQWMAVLLNGWVLWNAVRSGLWLFSTIAFLETAFMFYTTWTKPQKVSSDWWGWAAAIFIMVFPLFATDVLQVHEWIPLWRSMIGDFLMVLAVILEIVSLVTLNTAFTQLPEARKLVTRGIYRFVRHPLYTAYFLSYFGQAFQWNELSYWITFLVFVMTLILRAKAEEHVLSQTFSGYKAYQKEVNMFGFPTKKP